MAVKQGYQLFENGALKAKILEKEDIYHKDSVSNQNEKSKRPCEIDQIRQKAKIIN